MSNDLMIFNTGAMQVPAHVAQFFDANETNIVERDRVPTLNITGKVWTIALRDGTKTQLTRRNADGDTEMVQTLRVVVLDYAKQRGRAYYTGSYDPELPGRPVCWSEDGDHPDANVAEPQAVKCAACPMSVKGSKITDANKSVTACSQHRNVVVMPVVEGMSFEPLRLKLAITSLFDKQSPDLEKEGWRAFENYMDFLRGNGVKHTATLVTKMRFDPNAAYPKVIFSPERWLEPAEIAAVESRMTDGSVEALLRSAAPEAAEPAHTPMTLPGPLPAPVAVAPARPAAPPAAPKEVKPAAKKAAPAPAQIELTLPEATTPVVAPAPAAKPAPAAIAGEVPDDVKALLAEWGDD